MPAHVKHLSWSADQIKAERQRKLRETLAYAKAKSPWHVSRLADIDAGSFTEGDLQELPVTSKTDVMTKTGTRSSRIGA
jgi:phenylacetate-CoA ligase